MATAFEVMSKAKAKGRKVNAEIAFNKFREYIDSLSAIADKARERGGYGAMAGATVASKLLPLFGKAVGIGGKAVGTGGASIVSDIIFTILGAGGTAGITSIVDALFRGGKPKTIEPDKKFKDFYKGKGTSSIVREFERVANIGGKERVTEYEQLEDRDRFNLLLNSLALSTLNTGKMRSVGKDVRAGLYGEKNVPGTTYSAAGRGSLVTPEGVTVGSARPPTTVGMQPMGGQSIFQNLMQLPQEAMQDVASAKPFYGLYPSSYGEYSGGVWKPKEDNMIKLLKQLGLLGEK